MSSLEVALRASLSMFTIVLCRSLLATCGLWCSRWSPQGKTKAKATRMYLCDIKSEIIWSGHGQWFWLEEDLDN